MRKFRDFKRINHKTQNKINDFENKILKKKAIVMLCQNVKTHQILFDLVLSTHSILFRKLLFFFHFYDLILLYFEVYLRSLDVFIAFLTLYYLIIRS